MPTPTPEQLKKLKRLAKVLDGGDVALLTQLHEIETELSNRIDDVDSRVPQIDAALAQLKDGEDGEDGYTPIKGVDYFDGKDGENYLLTENDKKEIAKKIEVPVVEKVIEKITERVEVEVRQPITEIKEVATLDDATIAYLENKIETVEQKIEDLPKHKETNFGRVIREIQAGSNITVDNSDPNRPVVSATGGGGSVTKGIAEVDFGVVTQQNDIATVSVSDVAITATSYPSVSLYAVATTDHDPDDYMAEALVPYVTNVSAGVGFDIAVRAPDLTWGKYKVTYQY